MGLAMPVTCKVVQNHNNDYLTASYASMQGYRETMEDAHSIVLALDNHPNASFFGVYDGHGGAEAAAFAAREIHKRLDELPELTEETIGRCVLDLDADFLRPDNEHRQHGSTVVFAVVKALPHEPGSDEKRRFDILVANVGDSRCLSGRIPVDEKSFTVDNLSYIALSDDHKPILPGERARIMRAGGFVEMGRVDARLALSRAIGDSMYKANSHLGALEQKVVPTPDFARTICTEDHYLLIACDGIFESMSNDRVAAFIAKELANGGHSDPSAVLDRLLEASLAAGSRDNMTAILVLFQDHGKTLPHTKKQFVTPDIPDVSQSYDLYRFVEAYMKFAANEGFEEEATSFLAKKGYGNVPLPASSSVSTSSLSNGIRFDQWQIFVSVVLLVVSYLVVTSSMFKSFLEWPRR